MFVIRQHTRYGSDGRAFDVFQKTKRQVIGMGMAEIISLPDWQIPLLNYIKHTVLEMDMNELISAGSVTSLAKNAPSVFTFEHLENDPLSKNCETALFGNASRYTHTIVEDFFLRNDAHTWCVELPVVDDECMGFIDLIRVYPGELHVCDYKPKAHKEAPSQVGTQLYKYSRILKDLIPEIPLIRGFYFDDKNTYRSNFTL